jgi:hypothetical protein
MSSAIPVPYLNEREVSIDFPATVENLESQPPSEPLPQIAPKLVYWIEENDPDEQQSSKQLSGFEEEEGAEGAEIEPDSSDAL